METPEEKPETEKLPPPPAWPRVLKLKHPVKLGEDLITELTFRRGIIRDMKDIKLGGEVATNDLVKIASRLSGQPTQVIEQLDVEDGGEAMDIALDFFTKFLATGKKP